jgi:lipid-A-disaccharide synthase
MTAKVIPHGDIEVRSDAGPGYPVPGPVLALVAGEDSGDQLGADLIEALRARFPRARFVGVGGPRMRAAGFDSWHDISALSVMGLAEVLRHLPRLLRLRASLAKRMIALKPALFIGIDAPDFNLGLERKLKQAGIRTAHYVSPSVWAWREGRATGIGHSTDCVLCLFPMEPAIYARHGGNAEFVGHPLADRFPLDPDRAAARARLGLPADAPVLAVLPGSRLSEIRQLDSTFIEAARRVAESVSGLRIVVPAANERCREELEKLLGDWRPGTGNREPASAPGVGPAHAANAGTDASQGDKHLSAPRFPVPGPVLLDGHAHDAMVAADAVLVASGTATLETMLAKRPMVVAYRIAPLTYALVKGLGMLKTDTYALPNILAGRKIVPELMQSDCTPDRLADAVTALFRSPEKRDEQVREFGRLHLALRTEGGAAASAARVIGRMLGQPDAAARDA